MSLRLPLPNAPAGSVAEGMGQANSLSGGMIDNQIKRIQAQYAPLTTQAEAASKLAYANLMGPQFLAKLMGNQSILANIPDAQKYDALNKLYQAGTGAGTGFGFLNQLQQQPQQQQQQQSMNPFAMLLNKARGMFGMGGQQNPQQGQIQSQNIMNQPGLTPQDRQAVSQLQPGQSYTLPEQPYQTPRSKSFAENVGIAKGIENEGGEAGKIRAQNVQDLSDTVFSGRTKLATMDEINKLISSPEFERIRNVPLAGRHELSYYAKLGTPEQQNMIGQLRTLSGNVIRDASQDFKGAFRRGEQQLLESTKINEGDTVNTARGKMEQLTYLTKMIVERAKLTGNYMEDYHISKLKAEELADRQINGESERQKIHNTLNPKPTDIDINHMAEKYKISKDEVKKRLKQKGIL